MNESILLTETIVFEQKPIAVPYNYRISYKVALILLIIKFCCSSRSGCSLTKINIINCILANNIEIDANNMFLLSNHIAKSDPVITRGLNYALAEGLIIQQKDGKFRISLKGKEYVDLICKQEDLMIHEKDKLKKISVSITEENIKAIMSEWRYIYDQN